MTKVLIFSSYAGGGHVSASYAIEEYLKPHYEVKTVYIFGNVLGPVDPIKLFTFGYCSVEDFYNYCLRKKWTWFLNKLFKFALAFIVPLRKRAINKLILCYLKKENPDLVISVVPIVNGNITKAAKLLQIPFLIVPTDLDPTYFIYDLDGTSYQNLFLAFSFNDKQIKHKLVPAHIPEQQIFITGFPIRKDFFEPKDKASIKETFLIPENKPVIMLLMGAAGSQKMFDYVEALTLIAKPFHLLICLGRNEPLRIKIETIPFPQHISTSIIGHTEKIADLMAVSDILITKTGTVSVCEAIYMNLPMILDRSSTPLLWEKFNLDFVIKHHFGTVVSKLPDLNIALTKFLEDKDYKERIKQNIVSFKRIDFNTSLLPLVDKILKNN